MRLAIGALSLLSLTAVAGCSGESNDPVATSSSTPEEKPTPEIGTLGDTATIEGTVESAGRVEQIDLAITPNAVEDPAENDVLPAEQVEKGTRWVRVDLRIVNRGDAYNAPLPPFELVTGRGERVVPNLSSAPWRMLPVDILPGDRVRGAVGFLVPKSQELDELRFTLSPGSPEGVLRWNVSRGR